MTDTPLDHIRNFSIIAHIDHGKSTLADRLIQATGAVAAREMKRAGARQHGDRARARHHHQGADRPARLQGAGRRDLRPQPDGHARPRRLRLRGQPQPGRLRGLAAGGRRLARASRRRPWPMSTRRSRPNHEIVPVLNKIDLPAAEPDRVKQQIEDVIGLDASDAVLISAKTGLNIEDVLEAMVTRLPPPKGDARRAAQGAAGRQLVRPLSRRGDPGARQGRPAAAAASASA